MVTEYSNTFSEKQIAVSSVGGYDEISLCERRKPCHDGKQQLPLYLENIQWGKVGKYLKTNE